MKAIMYHYVQEFDKKHPFFRFLDIKQFRKQLDFFGEKYGFLKKEEWDQFINIGKIKNLDNKVILTFDDGLSCHFDYVFPELEKRGLWGIFYVSTKPYLNKKILDVHRIHLICGAFDGERIYQNLCEIITDKMIQEEKREEFKDKTYLRQKNNEYISKVKKILNYFIHYEFREQTIDDLAKKLGYKFNHDNFYISTENLKKMHDSGQVIGSHTINHKVMSKLSAEEQNLEIKDSFNYLDNLGCIAEKTYCHPYGGFHSFNKDTLNILKSENVAYSFNVEQRDINLNDFYFSKQHLPRFDCNQFAFGKAS